MAPRSTGPPPLHVVWLAGASCDGCTTSVLGASEPGLEDFLAGRLPDLPPVELVHPVLALEGGGAHVELLERAARGELSPFLLVLEGSVLDAARAGAGSFSRIGPRTAAEWIDRLAPAADAVVAIGSCAVWGGVPAAAGNATGATGLADHLGAGFRSRGGLPVVNVPGCAPSGEAFLEVLASAALHLLGLTPLELDEEGRPRWLYPSDAVPGPPRVDWAGREEPPRGAVGERTEGIGCPVPSRGWMRGVGGCTLVGGSCIGCTDRDFTDRHLAAARPPGPPVVPAAPDPD